MAQSIFRQVKRGHVRFKESQFVKNLDGTPKLIKERRTSRGKWVLA